MALARPAKVGGDGTAMAAAPGADVAQLMATVGVRPRLMLLLLLRLLHR